MGQNLAALFVVFISWNAFAGVDKPPQEYWQKSSIELKNVQYFINNKNCYDSEKFFVACVEGLNELAAGTKKSKSTMLFYDSQYVATHPEKIKNIIQSNGPLTLAEPQFIKTFNELSPPTVTKLEKLRREEYEATLLALFESKGKVNFDKTLKDVAGEISDKSLEKPFYGAAINGYLEVAFDPHTGIQPKQLFTDEMAPDKPFAGIGAKVAADKNGALVDSFLDDSAGGKIAGLKEGDIIKSIDGASVVGVALDKIVDKLRGPIDSKLTVVVSRNNQTLQFVVVRKKVEVQNVVVKVVSHMELNFVQIKIKQFSDNTCKDTFAALIQGIQQTKGTTEGVILDLRGNPGGLLQEGVCTAALFLSSDDKAVSLRDVHTGKEESYHQRSLEGMPEEIRDAFQSIPMVVLIDGGSASASEIVAGTLQDYKRAWLVGERSYGKGTAQSVLTDPDAVKQLTGLKADFMFKFTDNRFYLPSGTSNQIIGLMPEFVVPFKPGATDDERFVPREEDMYTSAFTKVTDSRPNTRFKETNWVQNCLDDNKATDSTYRELKSKNMIADYQLIRGEEVLGCSLLVAKQQSLIRQASAQ